MLRPPLLERLTAVLDREGDINKEWCEFRMH